MSNPTGTRNGARNGALNGALNGTPPPRRIHPAWLLGALALTLVAAYFAPEGEHAGVVLSERAAAQPPRSALASAAPASASPSPLPSTGTGPSAGARVLSVTDREAFTGDDALFTGEAPVRQLPVRVQAAPPPADAPSKPQAPALPLKMIGRYVDNGAPAAFVLLQDQSLVLRVGDAVAEGFRVEHIDEVSLTVRHLPTEQRQSFRLDGAP